MPSTAEPLAVTTANPGVSSKYHWLEILAQTRRMELAHVNIFHDPDKQTFAGTTDNVARLALDLSHLTWSRFVGANLLPVTIGNVIGGAVMVGAVYWFVYLRGRPAP